MNDKILQDVSSTGKKRPWREHKMANELLSLAYDQVRPDKAKRCRECATRLIFEVGPNGKKKLSGTWFCRVRLCPMCSWRRSLKVAGQTTRIIVEIDKREDKPKAYILLTLTQRNCLPDELDEELTRILKAFEKLTKRKRFKDAILGHYRSLEVTHNLDSNTYHPHIHVLLCVDPKYFKGKQYITQTEWVQLWRDCMGLDYDPSVDVRRVIQNNTSGAVAEVAKYAVKSGDYLIPDDWDLTVETVSLLDRVLHNRRFVAYGGILKKYHKLLNLDSEETGDLIHVDPDNPPKKKKHTRYVSYLWYSGYRQYRKEDP